jgi:hypothetical protein
VDAVELISGQLWTVINCTLAENSANGGQGQGDGRGTKGGGASGGAVHTTSGVFVNVTMSGNRSQPGYAFGDPLPQAYGSTITATNGTVTLVNTILTCAAGETNVWGTVVDGGHNICSDVSARFTLGSSMNDTDPMLAPLAGNGGPTPTMALLRGSPAIDAGNGLVAPGVDQRGVSRPQGSGCDIGAFELAPKLKLRLNAGETVKVEYQFLPLKEHRVFASTDLVQWLELGKAISDTDGAFQFDDRDWNRFSKRFYHVKPQSAIE